MHILKICTSPTFWKAGYGVNDVYAKETETQWLNT